MSRLREFGESAASAVLERVGRGVSRVQERKPLPSDLLESDDAYLVVFDAPGATRSDVQVRFVEGEVQVRIDRFRDFHEGYEMRFPGRGLSLDGSVTLPGDAAVDAEEASATLAENGVLKIRVPKVESDTADEVAVEDETRGDAVDVTASDADDGHDGHDGHDEHEADDGHDGHDEHDDEDDA